MIHVLFVCLGNICRSPTAEGVFRHLLQSKNLSDIIEVDSAGTSDWHIGLAPDPRSQKAALRRGIDLSHLKARQAIEDDFEKFDYIIAMDKQNHKDLTDICPGHLKESGHLNRLYMFLDFAKNPSIFEIPDPYFGNHGFDHVLDLCEKASVGLLADIQSRHL